MDPLDTAVRIGIWAIPILFAITVHEVAHGWVARALGDPTAAARGRLTLNPLRHIDPVGTVLVPALLLFAGGLIMGWARPVPVVAANLRHPRRDMALVAVAGPASNLLMAIAWALVARAAVGLAQGYGAGWLALAYMGLAGVLINLVLMLVNLVPVPPLDGGRVLIGMLPPRPAALLARVEPFGLLVLLGLLASGWLGRLLGPPMSALLVGFSALAGLPPHVFDQI